MSDALPLQLHKPPKVLREHQVRTLPALRAAIDDLLREATDRGHKGPINLTDFDPKHGVTVSLNDDGAGGLFIAFRRHRA
jgi:hypothetical protein